jgi:2-hydroxymuconate-semialdehyde hydrolase
VTTSETGSATSWVAVRGTRLRVRLDGDPALPMVLALHGIGRSLEDWSEQQRLLSHDHHLVSVDLPGFGLSEPLAGPVTLPALAAAVSDVLDAVGHGQPVHVVGNSLCGAVALQLLALRPERVASLTLANSAGFGSDVALALRLLAVPGLGRQLLRRSTRATAARTERSLFVDASLATDTRLDHALRLAQQPHGARVFLETARHLGTFRGIRPGWRSELLDAAGSHPRPTLVVWGERDLILPAHHLETARTHLPHARFHTFPDTGHMPQIERAVEFADLVRDLVRSAGTGPGRP